MPKRIAERSVRPSDTVRGKVRARDPFELIRWLALSQPDPRKALAELVQNSLDASARRIRISRMRVRGTLCLRVIDDGDGVIPEMNRPDALKYIATNIGHSRKRQLSPEERLTLMTQGQYGIGLLGFWSLGQAMEIRSAVPGQRAHRLLLYRDRPDYVIEPMRGRLALDERWTEVIVTELHREALPALIARRAADYLASELRGQLLAREVDLAVEDHLSRGRAQKLVQVRPPRFLGERLEGLGPVAVPGYPPVQFEVYLAGEASEPGSEHGIAIYSAGTLVAEGFASLSALGLDRAPWTERRLTGMVDFPSFRVAPGSRRGIVIDEAAGAFARAITSVEPLLIRILESVEQQREIQLDRSLVRDLQRAFRDFYRHRPRYAMLPVAEEGDRGAGPTGEPSSDGAPGGASSGNVPAEDPASAASPEARSAPSPQSSPDSTDGEPRFLECAEPESHPLFPPGPLQRIEIAPSPVRARCGSIKKLAARALDAEGRVLDRPVSFTWETEGPIGSIANETTDGTGLARADLVAAVDPANGGLTVVAHDEDGREARAWADVEVSDTPTGGRATEGIPEPEFVHHPGATWRSRMLDGRWQVNSGHRDFRTIADRPALKLRYLALLFSKEIVLRSHQDPRLERPLEQVIEVAAYADFRLSEKRSTGGKRGRNRGAASE